MIWVTASESYWNFAVRQRGNPYRGRVGLIGGRLDQDSHGSGGTFLATLRLNCPWRGSKSRIDTGAPVYSTRNTPKTERGRIETLDLLRAVAVLAVILFHYAFRGAAADGFTNISWPEVVPFAKYGYLGVQLFFVISGLVIAYSADGRTATGFAIARLSRIYPGFLFCMTLTFLATVLMGAPRFQATAHQWLANLLIVAPAVRQPFMDGAYWSIVYEITFYAWVYLLLAAGLFRHDNVAVVITWLAISIANQTITHSALLLRLLLTDQSAFFCAGLVLYEMHRGRRDLTIQLLLLLATLTAISQALVGAEWMRMHYAVEFDNVVIAGTTVAAIAAVGHAMRVRQLPLPKGWLIAIGGLTYPLYLLHQHIGYMLINAGEKLGSPGGIIVTVAITLIVASWAVWRYVEQPGQRWMKDMLTRGALGLPTGPRNWAPSARPLP
jgi:peptidoglycan/LPS O-acetylase OafA/YrhL